MAVTAFLVFAAALAAACWTIWATIAPERARILDLLRDGPVAAERALLHVPARSNLRNVRVRSVRQAAPTLRAAA